MTLDPLRGDPKSPEVQNVHWCARLLYLPEPELEEGVDVISPAELDVEHRGQIALGVLTVCMALAVAAPILTALVSLIMLTRRLV